MEDMEHLRPWVGADPNESVQNYITREVDRIAKEMALAVESGSTEELIRILRSKGYYVAPPGSAVPALVEAARRIGEGWYPDRCSELGELARKVAGEVTK